MLLLFLLVRCIVTSSSFLHISPLATRPFPSPSRSSSDTCQHQQLHYSSRSTTIINDREIVVRTRLWLQHQEDSNTIKNVTTRRHLLRSISSNAFGSIVLGLATVTCGGSNTNAAEAIEPPPSAIRAMATNAAETFTTTEDERIYQLTSGIQFRDIRIGSGPPITNQRPLDEPLLLHLKAITLKGTLLFDTKLDKGGGREGTIVSTTGYGGSPIVYTLGTTEDFDTFGGDSSTRSKVTQGVEDTILSRGLLAAWNGAYDSSLDSVRQAMEPMREGGMRRTLVPASLAYGNSGVSRYDAFKMGLSKPVPRDEMIVYEIELLRCLDGEMDVPEDSNGLGVQKKSVRACCTEDRYPCKITNQERQ